MFRCDTHGRELCILRTLHSGVHNAHSIGGHGNSGHFVGGVVLVQFLPCSNCPLPLLTCANVTLPVGNCVFHAHRTDLFRAHISSVDMVSLNTSHDVSDLSSTCAICTILTLYYLKCCFCTPCSPVQPKHISHKVCRQNTPVHPHVLFEHIPSPFCKSEHLADTFPGDDFRSDDLQPPPDDLEPPSPDQDPKRASMLRDLTSSSLY
jgi:hypothetical protein